MKVSMKWLSRYVDISDITPSEIMEILTMQGLESDSVEVLGKEISNVVVGRIEKLKKHENSDKLWICDINIGDEESGNIQIVTGARNLEEQDLIPVALHGSTLPGGIKIKKGKLRGEISQGMLCSGAELQLKEGDYPGAEVDGILILKENYVLGMDIKEALDLNDVVIETEPTSNRPDWQSMIGVAREVAVALKRTLYMPKADLKKQGEGDTAEALHIDIISEDFCSRYMAGCVSDIKVQSSPVWMRRALRAAGMRSINNIVDITNFVMLETGQPMHAFDASMLNSNKIIVRESKPNEKITTLDGKERVLSKKCHVIADEQKAIAIAGIMGGENSEVTDQTKKVIFESAIFDSMMVRNSSKVLGLNSDSSAKFIKGVDIEGTSFALERACYLVEKLEAGKVCKNKVDVVDDQKLKRKQFAARANHIESILGLKISIQEMAEILNRLDIPTEIEKNELCIQVPHFRDDLEGEADIAEEILRIKGQNQIEPTLMKGDLIRGYLTKKQLFLDKVKDVLIGMGAYEILTYSFTGNATYDKMLLDENSPWRNSVSILNPFGEDTALMRTNLLTGMLPVVANNAKKKLKLKSFRLFELGNIHVKSSKEGELPKETPMLCIAGCGDLENFYTLKGGLQNLLAALHMPIEKMIFKVGGEACFHPGRKAKIYLEDVLIGQMGEIHPIVAENFEIPERCYSVLIDLDIIFDLRQTNIKYHPISKFPLINRDFSLLVDKDIDASKLQECMREVASDILKDIVLFDVYEGKHLPEGKKSLAYSLYFESSERTLTDDEVVTETQRILNHLTEKLKVELRK